MARSAGVPDSNGFLIRKGSPVETTNPIEQHSLQGWAGFRELIISTTCIQFAGAVGHDNIRK